MEQEGDFFCLRLWIQEMETSEAAHTSLLGKEALLLSPIKNSSRLPQNKEDDVIMVLAQLALAEGIFSQARTDSMLFFSKAVETTVHVTGVPSPFPKYSC